MKQKEVKKLERIVKRDAVYNECLVGFQTSLQFDNQDELASCVCIEKKFGSCPGEKWKNPHDPLAGGIYSRGKSHILRLSVPIQLLLSTVEYDSDQDIDITSKTAKADDDCKQDEELSTEDSQTLPGNSTDMEDCLPDVDGKGNNACVPPNPSPIAEITPEAI
ncbi:hypothetical protein OS493_017564 [Desmophyllum pertusum]|uniref:Uncharacterized protein n=1 Tax=Desmophyllum pertusum TaxID=174260 RepID=A0A9W9ZP56_9CNID|nr:hypothetical protein OS493_017564 [Desmophyllum pertusum]